jgi:hypothetical protein
MYIRPPAVVFNGGKTSAELYTPLKKTLDPSQNVAQPPVGRLSLNRVVAFVLNAWAPLEDTTGKLPDLETPWILGGSTV